MAIALPSTAIALPPLVKKSFKHNAAIYNYNEILFSYFRISTDNNKTLAETSIRFLYFLS